MNVVSGVTTVPHIGFHLDKNDIYLSYVPFSHIYEQVMVAMAFTFEMQIGFHRPASGSDLQPLPP
jgi:long-subunit acyl-CoA synthetase (AMP-forming)